MKRTYLYNSLLFIAACFAFSSCREERKEGKLFIIGGGEISSTVRDVMVKESGLDKGGYGVILPMSSEEPDSAIIWHKGEFASRGCTNVFGLQFKKGESFSRVKIDSIRNARLIFISGGDQSRFMAAIEGTPVKEVIHEAYNRGTLVCGTSAGAALMSRIMITGNELKHPEPTGTFNTMEAKNVETIEGLGMLEKVIIDQHFIKRKRLNRSVTACMEHPDCMCIGIDESTAILVDGYKATVYGDSQVVVLRHPLAVKTVNGLLAARKIEMNIYLAGESFRIRK